MKRFVLLCIALFLTGTITGSCKKAAPPEAEPVKIGVILPLSGPAATYGIDAKSGIEFAIEQINEEGGIKSLGGARMKHVMVDDKTQAATGVSEFERLVTVEKVVACLGPMISAGMKAAFPYADRYKVPIFSGIGILVSKESYEYGRNMQVMPSDIGDFIIGGGASLMEEFNIPIEKVAHIAYDISAGPLQKRIIPKSATKYGLGDKLVLNELVSAKSDDLKPVALKVKASGAQMVLTGLPHKLIILWCKACYAVNYFPLISVGWSGTTDVAVWRGLGDKMAEETIGRPGWIGLAYWHKDLPYKPLQDFIKSYKEWVKKKELPEEVKQHNISGAQMVYFLYRAIEMAGSRNPQDINKALWDLSLKEGDRHLINPLVLPEFKFDPKTNYPINRQFLVGFWDENGKAQIAYPKGMRTAPPRKPDAK